MSIREPMLLEVEGPGLHPETVETRAAVDLISSFMELLDKVAATQGLSLQLRGLQVADKCLQLRMETAEVLQAQQAAAELDRLLRGERVAGAKGLAEAVRRFRAAMGRFGPYASFKVAVGQWSQTLEPREVASPLLPRTLTTLRARLIRIGVAPLKARFESASEAAPFNLTITREQAERYAPSLGQWVDIQVSITRGPLGTITGGRVVELFPMDEGAGGSAWLDWLTEHGRGWNEVEDHLKELGREDD